MQVQILTKLIDSHSQSLLQLSALLASHFGQPEVFHITEKYFAFRQDDEMVKRILGVDMASLPASHNLEKMTLTLK